MAAGSFQRLAGIPEAQKREGLFGMCVCVAEVALRAGLALPFALPFALPLPGAVEGALPPPCSAQPLASPAAFFGVLGALMVLAKSCLDTDVIEIQISLREAYLQTCPALEPAPPAQSRC